jgi:hypothetical protein
VSPPRFAGIQSPLGTRTPTVVPVPREQHVALEIDGLQVG